MNKLNSYWFGRPGSINQLKNAALYSDKITMSPIKITGKIPFINKNNTTVWYGKNITFPNLQNLSNNLAELGEVLKNTIEMDSERFLKFYGQQSHYGLYYSLALTKEGIKSLNVFKNAGILEVEEFDQKRWQLVTEMVIAEFENEELNNTITKLYDEAFRPLLQKSLSGLSGEDKRMHEVWGEQLLSDMRSDFQYAFYMGLIGAKVKDACPLTDDEIFTKILQLKSETTYLSKLNWDEIPSLGDIDYHELHTYTASRVINLTVPAFEKIPPEKIIELRDNEKQSLKKFRNKIYDFNKEVETNRKDPSQAKEEIDKKIKDEIIPRIKDLESAIENSYCDFIKKLGSDLIRLGGASLVGYLINNHALLIALGGSSIPLLERIWQYLIKNTRHKRNFLYYLIRIKGISEKYM